MAVLGLRFCARAFSSCGERGPFFIAVRGPLTIATSLVAEHRLQTRRLSSCGARALVAPRHVGSSQTRARTLVPCIGKQILNHCATREAPSSFFNSEFFSSYSILPFSPFPAPSNAFSTSCFWICPSQTFHINESYSMWDFVFDFFCLTCFQGSSM